MDSDSASYAERRRQRRHRAAGWLRPLALIPVVAVIGVIALGWPLIPAVAVTAWAATQSMLVIVATVDRPDCG